MLPARPAPTPPPGPLPHPPIEMIGGMLTVDKPIHTSVFPLKQNIIELVERKERTMIDRAKSTLFFYKASTLSIGGWPAGMFEH